MSILENKTSFLIKEGEFYYVNRFLVLYIGISPNRFCPKKFGAASPQDLTISNFSLAAIIKK